MDRRKKTHFFRRISEGGEICMQTHSEGVAVPEEKKSFPKKRKKISSGKLAVAVFIAVMLIYPLFRFAVMWGYINIRSLYISFTRYDLMTDSNIFVGTLQYKSCSGGLSMTNIPGRR